MQEPHRARCSPPALSPRLSVGEKHSSAQDSAEHSISTAFAGENKTPFQLRLVGAARDMRDPTACMWIMFQPLSPGETGRIRTPAKPPVRDAYWFCRAPHLHIWAIAATLAQGEPGRARAGQDWLRRRKFRCCGWGGARSWAPSFIRLLRLYCWRRPMTTAGLREGEGLR
jgi:hypothetical protein